jgi:hypothetical protein
MANKSNQQKKGVVILFAVLLVSVVLTISLGVFNITYRQLVLSSIARESEVAFAVADSARNCAVYWNSPERPSDRRPFGYYKYVDPVWSLEPAVIVSTNISCADVNVAVVPVENGGFRTSVFQLEFEIPDPVTPANSRSVCANVSVTKSTNLASRQTVITVDGYNLAATPAGSSDCVPTNLNRAVQRTIQTVING